MTYNLDEYCGLPPENDQSYRYFMNHNLFDHTDFRKDQLHIPNAFDGDAETVCREYDAAIQAAGGIDLQLLGIDEDEYKMRVLSENAGITPCQRGTRRPRAGGNPG